MDSSSFKMTSKSEVLQSMGYEREIKVRSFLCQATVPRTKNHFEKICNFFPADRGCLNELETYRAFLDAVMHI